MSTIKEMIKKLNKTPRVIVDEKYKETFYVTPETEDILIDIKRHLERDLKPYDELLDEIIDAVEDTKDWDELDRPKAKAKIRKLLGGRHD